MPFSFNPGQPAPSAGVQNQGIAPGSMQPPVGTSAPVVSGAPSVPDSPFLFMRNRDQGMSMNAYVQIILMLVTAFAVISAVSLFAYSQYLTLSINSKKEEIAQKDAAAKLEYPFDDMKKLSKRLSTLDKLLKQYVSVRAPLKLLENVVEKDVVFNDFMLTKSTIGDGYDMGFTVITTNYRSLIQQLAALNLEQYSKVLPKEKQKIGEVPNVSNGSVIKVLVTAPVFASGKLPDNPDFDFITVTGSSTRQTTTGPSTGSITP